jgi:flagellar operon protein
VIDPLQHVQRPGEPRRSADPAQRPGQIPGAAFGAVLEAQLAKAGLPLRFSGHAVERIERRGITVDEQALDRLTGGVERAAAKGARESLVLVDDTAFVVSVRNRTVITAVDREHMKEQVFTNIDSAVIA